MKTIRDLTMGVYQIPSPKRPNTFRKYQQQDIQFMDRAQHKFKPYHMIVLHMQNRALGWLVVVLILHLSHGIWALNGVKPQHKHLRHMINIRILSLMLQLKCRNPLAIHLMKAISNRRHLLLIVRLLRSI